MIPALNSWSGFSLALPVDRQSNAAKGGISVKVTIPHKNSSSLVVSEQLKYGNANELIAGAAFSRF
jgi:hypothetical protein